MSRRLVAFLLVLLAATGCRRERPPSDIFYNGKIVTVDRHFRIVEAMAIRDGRIVAVGMNGDIRRLADSKTKQVDLSGKTVLPGLIDSHVHAPSASMYEFEQRIPDMESIEDVLAFVRARAETTDARALDHVVAGVHHAPPRAALSNPRGARSGGAAPSCCLPHRAGRVTELDGAVDERHRQEVPGARTASPAASSATGKREPTGILRNCARYIRSGRAGPAPTPPIASPGCGNCWPTTTRSASPASSTRTRIRAVSSCIARCSTQNALTCRTFMAYGVDAQAPLDRIEAAIREAASNPLHQHNDMLWLRGIKAFLDGGMLTGSAYMREPWGVSKIYAIDDPTYRGVRFIEPEKLYRMAKLALANDLQFTAHSQGDAAVDAMVEAYDAHQPRRLPGPRPTPQHYPRELHESRRRLRR